MKVKVGDTVEILKGEINWGSQMGKFVGRKVIVTGIQSYRNDWQQITFDGDGDWVWESKNNHFRLITPEPINFLTYN